MKPPHKCSITAHRPNHFHPNCQNEKIFPLRWESRTANSSIPSRRTSPLGDTVPPPPPPEITASNPTPNRRRFTDAAAQPPPKARCRLPPDLDTANKPVQLSYKRCQTKPARKFTRISGEISQHGKSCKARVRSCQLNQQKVPTHQEETSQHGESNWTVLTHQWYTSQHGKSNTAMHSAKPATPNRPFFTNSFHRKILSLRQSENVGFHTTVRNSRFHSLNQKTPTATCRLIQAQHGKSCKAMVQKMQTLSS